MTLLKDTVEKRLTISSRSLANEARVCRPAIIPRSYTKTILDAMKFICRGRDKIVNKYIWYFINFQEVCKRFPVNFFNDRVLILSRLTFRHGTD